jgi:hypothetical protein
MFSANKRANLKEAKRHLIAASIPAKISSTQLGGLLLAGSTQATVEEER